MLGNYQLDPQEQTSVTLKSKYKAFHSQKCIWKYHLRNGGHFVQGETSTPEVAFEDSYYPSNDIFTALLILIYSIES